jgi:hypothetical protein
MEESFSRQYGLNGRVVPKYVHLDCCKSSVLQEAVDKYDGIANIPGYWSPDLTDDDRGTIDKWADKLAPQNKSENKLARDERTVQREVRTSEGSNWVHTHTHIHTYTYTYTRT